MSVEPTADDHLGPAPAPPETSTPVAPAQEPEDETPSSHLAEDMAHIRADVAANRSFAKRARDDSDQLVGQLKLQLSQSVESVLREVIYPIHDQLFRRLTAMESGEEGPHPFSMDLLENVEGTIERLGIQVIRPNPGEPFDVQYMEAAGHMPARFWRRADTVARVHSCGFAAAMPEAQSSVLRKARVNVYRKT